MTPQVLNVLLAAAPGMSGHILVHASTAASKLLRNSDKGGPDTENEEPGTSYLTTRTDCIHAPASTQGIS